VYDFDLSGLYSKCWILLFLSRETDLNNLPITVLETILLNCNLIIKKIKLIVVLAKKKKVFATAQTPPCVVRTSSKAMLLCKTV
jgi:hypothetical protein